MLKPCWQNTMLTVEDRLKAAEDEIERLTKQVSSYKLLTRSMEETKTFLLKKAEQNKEVVDTLGSEREANDVLTAENASLKAELAAAQKDANLWREREAKIKSLKERGFLKSPLRSEP